MKRQSLSELETENALDSTPQANPYAAAYEKPTIRRHAIIMTMAPQGSKMGHGIFPFASRIKRSENYKQSDSPYRKV